MNLDFNFKPNLAPYKNSFSKYTFETSININEKVHEIEKDNFNNNIKLYRELDEDNKKTLLNYMIDIPLKPIALLAGLSSYVLPMIRNENKTLPKMTYANINKNKDKYIDLKLLTDKENQFFNNKISKIKKIEQDIKNINNNYESYKKIISDILELHDRENMLLVANSIEKNELEITGYETMGYCYNKYNIWLMLSDEYKYNYYYHLLVTNYFINSVMRSLNNEYYNKPKLTSNDYMKRNFIYLYETLLSDLNSNIIDDNKIIDSYASFEVIIKKRDKLTINEIFIYTAYLNKMKQYIPNIRYLYYYDIINKNNIPKDNILNIINSNNEYNNHNDFILLFKENVGPIIEKYIKHFIETNNINNLLTDMFENELSNLIFQFYNYETLLKFFFPKYQNYNLEIIKFIKVDRLKKFVLIPSYIDKKLKNKKNNIKFIKSNIILYIDDFSNSNFTSDDVVKNNKNNEYNIYSFIKNLLKIFFDEINNKINNINNISEIDKNLFRKFIKILHKFYDFDINNIKDNNFINSIHTIITNTKINNDKFYKFMDDYLSKNLFSEEYHEKNIVYDINNINHKNEIMSMCTSNIKDYYYCEIPNSKFLKELEFQKFIYINKYNLSIRLDIICSFINEEIIKIFKDKNMNQYLNNNNNNVIIYNYSVIIYYLCILCNSIVNILINSLNFNMDIIITRYYSILLNFINRMKLIIVITNKILIDNKKIKFNQKYIQSISLLKYFNEFDVNMQKLSYELKKRSRAEHFFNDMIFMFFFVFSKYIKKYEFIKYTNIFGEDHQSDDKSMHTKIDKYINNADDNQKDNDDTKLNNCNESNICKNIQIKLLQLYPYMNNRTEKIILNFLNRRMLISMYIYSIIYKYLNDKKNLDDIVINELFYNYFKEDLNEIEEIHKLIFNNFSILDDIFFYKVSYFNKDRFAKVDDYGIFKPMNDEQYSIPKKDNLTYINDFLKRFYNNEIDIYQHNKLKTLQGSYVETIYNILNKEKIIENPVLTLKDILSTYGIIIDNNITLDNYLSYINYMEFFKKTKKSLEYYNKKYYKNIYYESSSSNNIINNSFNDVYNNFYAGKFSDIFLYLDNTIVYLGLLYDSHYYFFEYIIIFNIIFEDIKYNNVESNKYLTKIKTNYKKYNPSKNIDTLDDTFNIPFNLYLFTLEYFHLGIIFPRDNNIENFLMESINKIDPDNNLNFKYLKDKKSDKEKKSKDSVNKDSKPIFDIVIRPNVPDGTSTINSNDNNRIYNSIISSKPNISSNTDIPKDYNIPKVSIKQEVSNTPKGSNTKNDNTVVNVLEVKKEKKNEKNKKDGKKVEGNEDEDKVEENEEKKKEEGKKDEDKVEEKEEKKEEEGVKEEEKKDEKKDEKNEVKKKYEKEEDGKKKEEVNVEEVKEEKNEKVKKMKKNVKNKDKKNDN